MRHSFFAGAPAFPSLIQESRFRNEKAELDILNAPITSDFSGILRLQTENSESARAVSGQINIAPVNPEGSREIEGTLTVVQDGKTEEFGIGGGSRNWARSLRFAASRSAMQCRQREWPGVANKWDSAGHSGSQLSQLVSGSS